MQHIQGEAALNHSRMSESIDFITKIQLPYELTLFNIQLKFRVGLHRQLSLVSHEENRWAKQMIRVQRYLYLETIFS